MNAQYTSSSYGFQPERDPRQAVAMLVVVAIHVAAAYALTHWAFKFDTPKLVSALQVAILGEEVKPPAVDLPPPPPDLSPPPVMVDMPQIELPAMAEPQHAITASIAPPIPPAPAESTTQAPKWISVVEYLRPLAPQYPSVSRRMREEGLVVLRVLVDPEGRASKVEVHRSSGHPRLDRAAQDAVCKARFKPYIEDGVVQAAFVLIPVEFTLNHRVAQR